MNDKKKYEKALENIYESAFVSNILKYDVLAEQKYGRSKIQTNGNVYAKYIETKNEIILLGLVSKKGKLTRQDVPSVRKWIEKLENIIRKGKVLYTSTNNSSEPIINSILKHNPEFTKNVITTISFKEGNWNNIEVKTN